MAQSCLGYRENTQQGPGDTSQPGATQPAAAEADSSSLKSSAFGHTQPPVDTHM